MKEEAVLFRLQDIFRDVFGKEELVITDATGPDDIDGWDSLTHISILEAVQDEFDVKFSLEEMIELTDVGQIIQAIMLKSNNE